MLLLFSVVEREEKGAKSKKGTITIHVRNILVHGTSSLTSSWKTALTNAAETPQ